MNYWLVIVRYTRIDIDVNFFNNELDATGYYNRIKTGTNYVTLCKVVNTTDFKCLMSNN